MNDDRISELYKGEIWTDALQSRARRRVHWMCSQATGDSVIDIGCSQGIAAILLGREGYTVTGVDIQPSRIDYAREELTKESSDTQSLVDFQVANAARLPFEDDAFDSALLGEVIEHLTTPERVLLEVKRVVKPGGRIVITTPFGLSPHHDHKQTFYPRNLLDVLSAVLVVDTVDVVDRYFRVVCLAEDSSASHRDSIAVDTIDKFDAIWNTLDTQLLEQGHRVAALEKEAKLAAEQHNQATERQAGSAKTLMEQARVRHERTVADLDKKLERSKLALLDVQQRLASETRSRELAESASGVLEGRVVAAKDAATKRAERDWATVRKIQHNAAIREYELRRRIDKLERERWKLRTRLATERWKMASFRERKWWRIGGAIGAVKRNPLRILVLPFDLVSLLFSKSKSQNRPKPPPEPKPRAVPPAPLEVSGSAKQTQGEAEPSTDSTVPRLRPLLVTAPSSMSLAPPARPLQRQVRIAAILDTMSHDCFAPDCDLAAPTPNDWLEILEAQQPHLLLVESAWKGNGGSWEYKVGTYSHPESVGLPDLTALVDWCRARSVPTVFWNKEDPVHFEKFKEAARLFDVVFTTDANMVARYEGLPGSLSRVVDVLPFAAQPALHNPTNSLQSRDLRPVFAGAFYRNRHPERREQLEQLLDGALNHNLMIFDRMGGQITESFGFPERFQSSVAGTVAYGEMADVYRRHAVFLNANSVVDSPTMFSRRVFELLASGTAVVSTPSVGVERLFGDVVWTVDGRDEADAAISRLISDQLEWRRRSAAGIDLVFSGHTYSHRLARILEVAGVDVQADGPTLSLVAPADAEPWRSEDSADLANVLLTGSDGEADRRWPIPSEAVSDALLDDGRQVAAQAAGSWIVLPNSEPDPSSLRRLLVGARVTEADVIGFASSWSEAHTYTGQLPAGPCIVSRAYIQRHGWPQGPRPTATRIYLVSPRDA